MPGRDPAEKKFSILLGLGEKFVYSTFSHADMAQLVEHHLAKVGVAGSSPVVRSRNLTAEAIAPAVFVFEHESGLEPMRWNSVKKTAQWAVLCQLAYNHAIMDLRAYKETLNSLKTPMQGVFVVVLCTVAFVVWLGVLVVITKLLMG